VNCEIAGNTRGAKEARAWTSSGCAFVMAVA
jgi:hypothetical protein